MTLKEAKEILDNALALLEKVNNSPLTKDDTKNLKALLRLYAWYEDGEGRYLANSFFAWEAETKRAKVVVIQNNKVLAIFPNSKSKEPIKIEDCLFVRHDFGQKHYQSVDRNHRELQQIVDAHNDKHKHLAIRNDFLEAIKNGNAAAVTSQMLHGLRNNDPQGYGAVCKQFGKEIVEKALNEGHNDSSTELRKTITDIPDEDRLELARAIETEMQKLPV
jgi:hypothetical protein